MAGFTPNEGETLIANVVYKRTHVDRDANLELGLFTNASVSETTGHGDLTEPSGAGYARITLADASWNVTNDVASYAQQTFTNSGGSAWSGTVKGYFVATKSAGGSQRLLHIEVDANGPYTMNAGDTYKVTPSVTYA